MTGYAFSGSPLDAARIRKALGDAVKSVWRGLSAAGSPAVARAEIAVSGLDALDWLAAQRHEIKGYWSDRSAELELAAFGEAEVLKNRDTADHRELFQRVRQRLGVGVDNVRYYGGFRFGPWHAKDPSWRVFGGYRFILPQFELVRRGTEVRLACLVMRDAEGGDTLNATLASIEKMVLPTGPINGSLPQPHGRSDVPTPSTWRASVDRVLKEIARGDLRKVVLARRTCFEFAQPLDGFGLLRRLKDATEGCYHFCGSHEGRVAFVGASPERLYRRNGRIIFSEAVAGTRPRGATRAEDEARATELLSSAKDREEHRLVVESIHASLRPLCASLRAEPEARILKLDRLQHLVCRFEGRLRDGVDDADIMEQLHPTPAVGGYPREPALRLLNELEEFDRGYYAAPVGWVSGDSAEFAVALRCGIVAGPRLCLFSGAGIVQGSDAAAEWQEVESKIGTFLKVLTTP